MQICCITKNLIILCTLCIIGMLVVRIACFTLDGAVFDRMHIHMPGLLGRNSTTRTVNRVKVPDTDECTNLNTTSTAWEEIAKDLNWVQNGGRYKPRDDLDIGPYTKVALVVPYRDRCNDLKLFLAHMHPFLKMQNIEYVIYVVEMEHIGMFKKTVIMNAAFTEVVPRENTSCIIFHDVDMLPTVTENRYQCRRRVLRHLATALKRYNYTLPYGAYIGGVAAFPPSVYRRVNGYSNLYQGWGGEDDDMFMRLSAMNISIVRSPSLIGRYDSWSHIRQPVLQNRIDYIRKAVERMHEDGLNTVNYRLEKIEKRPLFTWMLITTNQTTDTYRNITPVYITNLKKLDSI